MDDGQWRAAPGQTAGAARVPNGRAKARRHYHEQGKPNRKSFRRLEGTTCA